MNCATKFLNAALIGTVSVTAAAQPGLTTQTTTLPTGAVAQTHGPDGSLFVFGSMFAGIPETDSLLIVDPAGNQTTVDFADGVTIDSPGGAAFDPFTGLVLVTDNSGPGELVGIDPTTGQTQVLASGIATIDDVAVSSTGQIVVSDAVGEGLGQVLLVNPDGSTTQIIDGLDFTAGLAFGPSGDLFVQDANDGVADGSFDFSGTISRFAITQDASGLTVGGGEVLASGVASSDLIVDSEGDVFISGSGGLFELDRDADGDFLGTVSNVIDLGFSGEVSFLAGDVAFDPFTELAEGDISPILTLVPGFGSLEVITLSVPEPGVAALLGLSLLALTARRGGEVQA